MENRIDPKSLRIGNTLEKEVIDIAIATIIANRDKASHGEPRQDIFGEDPKPEDFENDPVVKAAASVAMKWMCEFRDWYDKLSPAEKCTVWPPAGSGCGTGLYNMQTSDIVDKFLSYKKKLATPTEPDTKEMNSAHPPTPG